MSVGFLRILGDNDGDLSAFTESAANFSGISFSHMSLICESSSRRS
ncbi:hypothetical protein VCR15J2_530026 [Vibrio coralliirubri]|nr:hypothetical protein VCR15J2_530026 [Vibrio coralliirubri]